MAQKVATSTLVMQGESTRTAALQQQGELVRVLPSLRQEVAELEVESPEQYQYADSLLGRLHDMRKGWAPIWTRLQEKVVKPLRTVLDETYKINRDIDQPLEQLEQAVKGKMTAYKRLELQRAQAEEQRIRNEQARLEQEAEEKARLAQKAPTPQLAGRLNAQSQRLQEQAEAVASQELDAQVVAGHSSGTRTKKAIRIKNLDEFLLGIVEGNVLLGENLTHRLEMTLEFELGKLWKLNPDVVASWPGVEVYDDVSVVAR